MQCRAEIAAIETQIRAGTRNLPGLCLALVDWWAELRILCDTGGTEQGSPPRQLPGGPGGSSER